MLPRWVSGDLLRYEMKYFGLYHINAWTYADPDWFPSVPEALRAMFARVPQGMLSGTRWRRSTSKPVANRHALGSRNETKPQRCDDPAKNPAIFAGLCVGAPWTRRGRDVGLGVAVLIQGGASRSALVCEFECKAMRCLQ